MITAAAVEAYLQKLINSWTFDDGSDNGLAAQMEAVKICQLTRIAVALESIAETGVYTYPQQTEDPMDEQRTGRRQG